MKRKHKPSAIALILIFIAAAGMIIIAMIKLKGQTEEKEYLMPSNAARVEFLNSCGLIVRPDPQVQEIKIPMKFGEIYEQYNRMQQSQGFDLHEYAGCEALLLSYDVLNCPDHAENVTANLVIYNGILIACDLTLNEENGFTKPLIT